MDERLHEQQPGGLGAHLVVVALRLDEGLEQVDRGDADDAFDELVAHPKVLKVVALSGGFSRDEANARLARNKGIIASFSRALSEGLNAKQSDAEFNKTLDTAIQSIYEASIA